MTDESPVLAGLGDARSVLVLADGLSATRDAVCGSLLARSAPDRLHAVAVTYNRSAREWIGHAESSVGGSPRTLHVVDTGGDDASPNVRSAAPDDLTGIEIAVTDPLPYGDGTTVFCFDSLTALLQYVDRDRAYRFLHALVEHLWTTGTYAHFHMDPAAHDAETVLSLAALFDAAVATDPKATPAGVDTTVTVDGEELAVSRRPRFEPEGNA